MVPEGMCLGYDFASKGNTFQQNHADTADVGEGWKQQFLSHQLNTVLNSLSYSFSYSYSKKTVVTHA